LFVLSDSAAGRCKLWLWDGNVWVPQHLSGSRLPQDYGCVDTSRPLPQQQTAKQDKETTETSLLDRDLCGQLARPELDALYWCASL